MNICWIEDFGGNQSVDEILANQLFSEWLTGGGECFDEWELGALREDESREALPDFTREQSRGLHSITLFRHYTDYAEYGEHDLLIDFDLYVVDIRLANKDVLPLESRYPDHVGGDSDQRREFNEHAGLYIYNDLICKGVPQKAIAIMTGQAGTLDNFRKKQGELYWSGRVSAFEKGAEGFSAFSHWLEEQTRDPYRSLRRAVVSGCMELLKQTESLQFNRFIGRNEQDELVREFTERDFHNYLGELLSAVITPRPFVKKQLYHTLVSRLVHPWEGANLARESEQNPNPAEIVNGAKNSSADRQRLQFGWILKNTRNWISHGDTLSRESFTETQIAFLMLLNFRCMVQLSEQLAPYEVMLLKLIQGDSTADPATSQLKKARDKFLGDANRPLDPGRKPPRNLFKFYSFALKDLQESEASGLAGSTTDFKRTLLRMIYFVDKRGDEDVLLNQLQQVLYHHV